MPQTLRLIVLACFVACFAAPPALRAGVAMPPALSNEISQLKVNWQSVQVRMNWTNERTSSISLNLQGFLPEDITDRLVGYRVDIDELNDADGVSLLPKDENGQSRPSKGSMTFMAPPLKGGNIARIAGQRVAVNLRDIQMPSGPLSDVRGRIRLLTAVEYHNVDLPLKEGASVELTPGLTLHLEKVAQGGRQRTISFRIESDRPELKLGERGHAPFIWSFQVLGDNNAVDANFTNPQVVIKDAGGEFRCYNYRDTEAKADALRLCVVTLATERTMRIAVPRELLAFSSSRNLRPGPLEALPPENSAVKLDIRNISLNYFINDANGQPNVRYSMQINAAVTLNEDLNVCATRTLRVINLLDFEGRNVIAQQAANRAQFRDYQPNDSSSSIPIPSVYDSNLVRPPKGPCQISGDTALLVAHESSIHEIPLEPNARLDLPDDASFEVESTTVQNKHLMVAFKIDLPREMLQPGEGNAFVQKVELITADGKAIIGRPSGAAFAGGDRITGTRNYRFFNVTDDKDASLRFTFVESCEQIVVPFRQTIDFTREKPDEKPAS